MKYIFVEPGNHIALFDIRHDVGSNFKGDAVFACVSTCTTHVQLGDGDGVDGDVGTDPTKADMTLSLNQMTPETDDQYATKMGTAHQNVR